MTLVLIMYMLFASTFTFGKAVLFYIDPILFIGIRMTLAGCILLIYYSIKYRQWQLKSQDISLFFKVIFFHIYAAYILEFSALQFVSSAKACLIYNLSPFITALLLFFLYNHRLSKRQFAGLCVGILGLLPIIITYVPAEAIAGGIGFFSWPEAELLLSVIASAYGWITVKKLVTNRGYHTVMVNGISMLGGGIGALLTSFRFGKLPFIDMSQIMLISFYTIMLVLIANIICYNLYVYLLKRYSPTFLSFAGFTTPLYAALFGRIFLNEHITWNFFVSLASVMLGLYLFYENDTK